MLKRQHYYSIRTGQHKSGIRPDLAMLQDFLRATYNRYEAEGYFQEAFGYCCIDQDQVPGSLGIDIEGQVLLALRKTNIWPISENYTHYSEEDCFDMIEFLFDHVSKPKPEAGFYHNYNNCGWHYEEFCTEEGQAEFRKDINSILQDYTTGWELSEKGEILALAAEGMGTLLEAQLPDYDYANVGKRVEAAIHKFRTRNSTPDDRRDAVRDLADVLEFLRPRATECLLSKKDEGDLFQIANRFGIRHHDGNQQVGYNKAVWYGWMFYFYLATIHAAVRVIEGTEERST